MPPFCVKWTRLVMLLMRTPATRGCRATRPLQATRSIVNLRILSMMSHVCGRTSSAKGKSCNLFYRKIKPASIDALPTGKAGADCKCGNCNKSESQHRMKKLRSRKERNQTRDGGKEAPRYRSCHQHYNHQTSKDIHLCWHKTSDAHSNIVPVTHEPSVITDSRLIGHHGLFNHEVKSIDIERLLSEQRKLDRSEKRKNEKSMSTFANPPANETEYLLDSPNDEPLASNKKALPIPDILNSSKRREKKTMESNSQGSDLTPGQRSRTTLISSTETNQNNISSDVVINGIKEDRPDVYENKSDSCQTPCSFNENDRSILPESLPPIIEHTPKNSASASNLSQVGHTSHLLPSSPLVEEASNSFNTQQENLDADSVAMSVKAIAASLCNSVSFSLLRENKNLVTESREVLVKALRQRHGAQLKSNILKVQQRLYSYDDDGPGEVSELSRSLIFADGEELPFSTGEFLPPSKVTGFATSSFEKTGRLHFDWNSTDWSNPLDPAAEWLGPPTENPVVPDCTFSRSGSPQFSQDFEIRNSVSREEREHLFTSSFAPSCLDGPRSFGHDNNFFISAQRKEFAAPESTNDYIPFSNIRTARHRRSPLNYSVDPFHSVSFPQMNSSFETHNYSYGKSFSDEIRYFHHESSFEPSRHVSFPSASPAFRPVDLAHYPPSHIVERGHILSTSSTFPSPEHWSFPPMRLY